MGFYCCCQALNRGWVNTPCDYHSEFTSQGFSPPESPPAGILVLTLSICLVIVVGNVAPHYRSTLKWHSGQYGCFEIL